MENETAMKSHANTTASFLTAAICLSATLATLAAAGGLEAGNWPQWRGPTRDGVWHESGIVEKFETSRIRIRWGTHVSSGYSGPTVADGRVSGCDYVSET